MFEGGAVDGERTARRLRSILDASRDAIMTFDRQLCVRYVNEAAARMSGVAAEEWIGNSFAEMGYTSDAAAEHEAAVLRVFRDGVPRTIEGRVDTTGGPRWLEASLSPVFDDEGVIVEVVSDNRDITTRRTTEDLLSTRASHDPLTGLVNRRALLDDLDRALAAGHRSGRATGVLMIDLDRFKNINDSLGHATGDDVIVATASRLESVVRAGDLVARLGGDEFVVVMRDVDDVAEPVRQADRILAIFRAPLRVHQTDLYSTASIGITISRDTATATDLLREADTALYVAKQSGRDRASLFNDDLRTAVASRLAVERLLRPAMERGEFAVWYQPEVDLTTGEIVAMEALVRWHHPSGEMFTAARFIDAAEESGLITDLGEWVLLEACRQAAGWNSAPDAPPLALRVNLSAREIADPNLLVLVASALEITGLHPRLLCLELNESAMLATTPVTTFNLQTLHDQGVGLAIDDFGTGYAALAALRDLRVDALKIDSSFVANIAVDDRVRRLVDGIVAFAERLGVDVIAEGIERPEQAAVLRELGCAVGQGFLYSGALRPDEVRSVLRR